MTDINNNINKFVKIQNHKDVKIQKSEKEPVVEEKEISQEQTSTQIQDTGILGRSQVIQAKAAESTKSIDEAVALAQNNAPLLTASEKVFEDAYERYIQQGKSEFDAYTLAAYEEEFFLSMANK